MTEQKQGEHGTAQNPRDPDFVGAEAALRRGCRTLASPSPGTDWGGGRDPGRKSCLGRGPMEHSPTISKTFEND